ncbi:MAG: cache domain-containing protein [Candidatus Omnitrophica bacterium]|nr:cache domain-containing protein [Candidatus Omnitrophota bacterium]
MKTQTLKSKILFSFVIVILALGVSIALLGFYLINNDVIKRAQNQVKNDLNVAHLVYNNELDIIQRSFSVVRSLSDPAERRGRLELDYFYVLNKDEAARSGSEIVKEAFRGKSTGGTRLIPKDELLEMGRDLFQRSKIEIKPTPKAKASDKREIDDALAIEYAKPILGADGKVSNVIYGGKILNRNFSLVDKIKDYVYGDKTYDSKPIGTVTIFLDDTRITTNVPDKGNQRAIGTRVSQAVYDNVVGKGIPWLDRAFVVTDWYLTAYEPIRNINGKIIGILYVGILEKPFNDLRKNVFFVFTAIILLGAILAVVLSFILEESIVKPFTGMIEGAGHLSAGDLSYRVKTKTQLTELNELAQSFNRMAEKLSERDKNLKEINEKLTMLNKSYLDLLGFVSHELKGILGSIVMNIYSLKEGFLGTLNEKQAKAINSAARILDHFETMVKNYLDFSRIEKGELEVKKSGVDLNEDIIKPTLAHFEKQILEGRIGVSIDVPSGIKLKADKNLLVIVCDNLLGNAVKYNADQGRIVIAAEEEPGRVKVSFYNTGTPIKDEEKSMLFKKFSRLTGSEKVRGTGIGLYITRQIVEKHGGSIWVEPQADGNKFIFTIVKGA